MSIQRIAVICGYPFPDGLAPTVRLRAYSKGLVMEGVLVDIFVFFPTDKDSSSWSTQGYIEGISYHYPGTRSYPQNKIIRKLSHPFFYLKTLFLLIKEHRIKRFDFVVLSTDWFRILYLFIPIVRIIGSKAIFIADEYPVPIRGYLKNKISVWRKMLFKNSLRYVHGMIFMTNNLKNFYTSIVRKPSYILPTILDVKRFSLPSLIGESHRQTICYMGNMELSKDNVDNIIKAFGIVQKKYPYFELHLYGVPSKKDSETINSVIVNEQLEGKVILKGKISNDKVPLILKSSHILVSSQPITKRSEGGFPTKLGEYMASGTPTLMTDVGEISNYIVDGQTGWLCEPENIFQYADKLEYIIANYSKALEVARAGQEYVEKNFDCQVQSQKLKEFLLRII